MEISSFWLLVASAMQAMLDLKAIQATTTNYYVQIITLWHKITSNIKQQHEDTAKNRLF